MLSRYEYLKLLAPRVTDQFIITTISDIRREWYNIKPRDGNLYHVYMSGASAVALGLAVALPHRQVVCLDGDGSILMALSVLPAIAKSNPSNLTIVVFDNESYGACSLPTFTAGVTNLVGIAKEAGIRNPVLVQEGQEFTKAIDESFQANSASFIVVKAKLERMRLPNPLFQGVENKYRFVRYVEKTENIKIIKPASVKAKQQETQDL